MLFKNSYIGQNQAYKNIRDYQGYHHDKLFIEGLWKQFEPYADSNFEQCFKDPEQMNSKFWEMYLTCSLIRNGQSISSSDSGPDIVVKNFPKDILIEAVCPQKGETIDAVQPLKNNEVVEVREEPFILRIQNSIDNKINQYENWLTQGLVEKDLPFIVAISGMNIQHFTDYEDLPPWILKAITNIGKYFISFSTKLNQIVKDGYYEERNVEKLNGEVFNKDIFSNPKFNILSGIIYSRVNLLNHNKSYMTEDYLLIKNPNAVNPIHQKFNWISRTIIQNDKGWTYEY